MKYLLSLLLITLAFCLRAQQPPGPPPVKILSPWGQQQSNIVRKDTNFVFNKHYYDMEDHWVVFPKNPKYAFTKGMYNFGFIYFDAETGYTLINEGYFDINAQGRAYRDSTVSPMSRRRPGIAPLYPRRMQLSITTSLVAAIPDDLLTDLKEKKVPDWLPAYHHNNPDTVKTLARKLLYGHTFEIYAKDAARHVGEYEDVVGRLYGGVIKPDPDRPGSTMAFFYMGGGDYPDQKVTIIMKDINAKGQAWLARIIKPSKTQGMTLSDTGIYSATGKLFLFEGRPAVEIKWEELGMSMWVDRMPTASELENYK